MCMKHAHTASPKRKPVNISLPAGDIEEAKRLGLNISQIAGAALHAAVRAEQKRRYMDENREAIAEYNAFVEKHGVLITPMWLRDDVTF
jgi:antitoxin CcdA